MCTDVRIKPIKPLISSVTHVIFTGNEIFIVTINLAFAQLPLVSLARICRLYVNSDMPAAGTHIYGVKQF